MISKRNIADMPSSFTVISVALLLVLTLMLPIVTADGEQSDVTADLVLEKVNTDPGPYYFGDHIRYTMSVTNPGDCTYTISRVWDVYPDGFKEEFVTGSPVVLGPGQTMVLSPTYEYHAHKGGEVVNELFVTYSIQCSDGCGAGTQSVQLANQIIVQPTPTPTPTPTPEPGASALRIYGEECANAAFPYTDPEAPFDPESDEAPEKDFVTFNPAAMTGIVVNQVDSKEKVFVRQWFGPVCYEPFGNVWLDNPNMYESEDVFTEYTYMLVDKHYDPVAGTPEGPNGEVWTRFWFPVADNDDTQIGLDGFDVNGDDVDDMTYLKEVGDFDADGRKDISISSPVFELTKGDELNFMDHKIVVKNVAVISGTTPLVSLVVDIYYTGNDEPEMIEQNFLAQIVPGEFVSAGRHAAINGPPNFNNPWYLQVTATGGDEAYMTVGRLLHTEETFFVDAAEYDIAMIFGPNDNDFKYITIRNPIPEHYDVNLEDLSVIKKSVADGEILPMLPPFNRMHTMVDDINIPHTVHSSGLHPDGIGINSQYNTVEERLIHNVGPMEIYFTGKDIESRFDTNLLEILDEVYAPDSSVVIDEKWQWLDIHTMPDMYKEFVYPALPDIDNGYGDYIVTLSFWAPNSNGERVKFVYDQEVGAKDLYVNNYTDYNTLRLYGEDGLGAAFPYTDPEAPFDPLNDEAPEKDFVTLNPAEIDDIIVSNVDSKMKVFMRQWFVPWYQEPTGRVWLDNPNLYYWEDVVSEYTYMFIDKHYEPVAGTTQGPSGELWTRFWFPVADNDDTQIGLDGYDVNGDTVDDMTILREVGDFDGDGRKDISISSPTFELHEGDELQFLDHTVKIVNVNVISGTPASISLMVDIYYNGNDVSERIEQNFVATIVPGEFVSAGRHAAINAAPNFNNPWYLQAIATGDGRAYVAVGRLLHTAESFFVDGAEYDVAMIYGPTDDSLKYITIRNPVPEHQDVNLEDLSVIKESVDNGEVIPVLPPFNRMHTMVDDIDIPDSRDNACPRYYENHEDIYSPYDTVEERLIPNVSPLEIYFIEKGIEPRFHTNLLEILREDGDFEEWMWRHIHTMPDFYKEFVYPERPDIDGGNGDYLVTSSFRASNSCDERVMFAYDATDGTGLYINERTPPTPPDWNLWDDDCEISNTEISLAEWHWATNTPVNGHLISNAEISILEYQWVTDDIPGC